LWCELNEFFFTKDGPRQVLGNGTVFLFVSEFMLQPFFLTNENRDVHSLRGGFLPFFFFTGSNGQTFSAQTLHHGARRTLVGQAHVVILIQAMI